MKNHLLLLYLKSFIYFIGTLLLFRIIEISLVYSSTIDSITTILKEEVLGYINDCWISFLGFISYFPFFYLISKYSNKIGKIMLLLGTLLVAIIQILCLTYFKYQLIPLDVFIYKYSFNEMWMTVQSADAVNVHGIMCMIGVFCMLYSIGFLWFMRKQFTSKLIRPITGSLIGIGLVASLFYPQTKYSQNKGYYFMSQSFKYITKKEDAQYTKNDRKSFQALYPGKKFTNTQFPLLHQSSYPNVLGPYFKPFDKKPNIVLLIVEGLNNDYIQAHYKGIEMMPNVRKLAQEGLYWDHCLTLGERSFAALPSLTGSLPYGDLGFTLQTIYPYHHSLVSLLQANDYKTTFYYGQGAWFHRKNYYLNFNNINLICDKDSFHKNYKKIWVNDFFAGYNDKDLFAQSLQVIDTIKAKNRFDIYFTSTSHSPFKIDNQPYYETRLDDLIRKCKRAKDKNFLKTNKKYILSELFVDDAIQEFIDNYKKRLDYENTIFVITGDHPMTELPRENSLKRFHVPFILYSPKIKKPKTFTNVVSHLDFYETMLGLLKNYGVIPPKQSTALGSNLLNKHTPNVAFMNDNREVIDFLSGNYYLSNKELYRVLPNFKLSKVNNPTKQRELTTKLNAFQKTSKYVCKNDKIIPISLYAQSIKNKCIYYRSSIREISCSAEYTNILQAKKITNKRSYVDISFRYDKHPDPNITFVYQLQNNKNEVLFWKNVGIRNDEKEFQYRIELPKQITKENTVKLSLLFWNRKKTPFIIKNLKVFVRQ